MLICVCVCRVPVHCVQYTAATANPAIDHDDADADDDDDVLREVMSKDEVTQLLQQVLIQGDHQVDLFTCCHSTTAAVERDVLDKLKTVSNNIDDHHDDDDDDDDKTTQQREFVLDSQQLVAGSLLPVNSRHRNVTAIRGQNIVRFFTI